MPVSSGNFTVGSDGSYATVALAKADTANLTGNLTFKQISALTETANFTVDVAINGFTLTFDSNTIPSGNPNKGHKITLSGTARYVFDIKCSGAGTINVRNQYLDAGSDGIIGSLILLRVGSTFTGTMNINDNLYNGQGLRDHYVVQISDNSSVINMWNNVVWDCNIRGAGAGGIAFYISTHNALSKYENNTAFNCFEGIDNTGESATYNNFLLFSNTTNIANNTGSVSNNCGTDATNVGAATDNGALVKLTITHEIESTTDTDANFLKIKIGSFLDDNGITAEISANTLGNRGNLRPGTDGNVSIGGDEFAYPTIDTAEKRRAAFNFLLTPWVILPLTSSSGIINDEDRAMVNGVYLPGAFPPAPPVKKGFTGEIKGKQTGGWTGGWN